MNIAQFSVTRPMSVTIRIAALVLLGSVYLIRLPINLFSNVSLPSVAIMCDWPNVAPDEIEARVTRPLKRAVSSVPGLDKISSKTVEGSAFVRVQLQGGTNVGQAAVNVFQQVDRVRRSFPTDPTLTTPVVFMFDCSQTPILVYGVSGMKDVITLRTILNNVISPILKGADGVAAVNVTGSDQRAFLVDVNLDKLHSRGLSLKKVSDRIIEGNLNLLAGIAKQSDTRFVIHPNDLFARIDDTRKIPVGTIHGEAVTLGEIASVRDRANRTRILARLNGEPAVGLLIVRQRGANSIVTANAVHQKIEDVKKRYPDLQFRLSYDKSHFVKDSGNRLLVVIIGVILASLMLLLFLRFRWQGRAELHRNTRTSVVFPRISGKYQGSAQGASAEDYRTTKAKEGVLSGFLDGVGKCLYALNTRYQDAWDWAGRHRWGFFLGVVAVGLVCCFLIPVMKTETSSLTDSGDFKVSLRLPVGASLSTTDTVMCKVEKALRTDPDIATVFAVSGTSLFVRGASATLAPNQGAILVKLKDDRKANTVNVITRLRKELSQISGIQITLS
jgi:multidrug efflux pump subunit AcrB